MDHDSNSSVFLLTTNDRFHASFSQFDEHCFYLLKSSASAQMVALDRKVPIVEICSKVVTSGYPDILILVQVGFQDWYNDKPRIWVQVWTAC